MKNIILSLVLTASPLAFPGELSSPPLTRNELVDKIVAAGVPRRGIEKLFEFRDRNFGVPFVTDIYNCSGLPDSDARACGEKQRIYTTKTVVISEHPFAVYIDFKRPSRIKRLWFINMQDGSVELQLVAHGAGSGKGPDPQKFSNRRNSRMTSLGMYVAGDTYRSGSHGLVMRLHGLDRSNNNAYVRDVIFHGAKYATEAYLVKKQNLGAAELDKIGESWGCPAVSDEFAQKVIPLLKNGALVFHDHEDLLDPSMTGEEVSLPQKPK